MKTLFRKLYCYFFSILRQFYLREGKKQKLNTFTKMVKRKSNEIGLKNSNFAVPSGSTVLSFQSTTSCRDMMKIMKVAYENEFLRELWKNKDYSISISGDNERVEEITTTVQDKEFEKYYKILGGKTGTLALVGNKLLICNLAIVAEIDNQPVIAVAMNIDSPDNRFSVMKQILDYAKGEVTELNIDNSTAYIVCGVEENGENNVICEKNADKKFHSASLAKMITTLTALDYIDNNKEKILIKREDLYHGSGAIFRENDIITFEDAIYAMLLCSSNPAAQAVARTVTEIIKNKNPTVKNGRADSLANAN